MNCIWVIREIVIFFSTFWYVRGNKKSKFALFKINFILNVIKYQPFHFNHVHKQKINTIPYILRSLHVTNFFWFNSIFLFACFENWMEFQRCDKSCFYYKYCHLLAFDTLLDIITSHVKWSSEYVELINFLRLIASLRESLRQVKQRQALVVNYLKNLMVLSISIEFVWK